MSTVTNPAFKIQYRYLIGLTSWLNEQSLVGKDSRLRTSFIAELIEGITALENERQSLLMQYAKKGKDGKPLASKDGKAFMFSPTNEKKVSEEYGSFLKESYTIDILTSKIDSFKMIKSLVLDTDYKFGPEQKDDKLEKEAKIRQANDYNEWCKAFEEVKL